jgi:hypothetical protein
LEKLLGGGRASAALSGGRQGRPGYSPQNQATPTQSSNRPRSGSRDRRTR